VGQRGARVRNLGVTQPGERSLLVATAGTILFVVLVPGTVVVLVPRWLSGWALRPPLFGWTPGRWIGVALLLVGLPVFLDFLVGFVRRGRGTPAPVAPPERLVVSGVFRWVRNPGYVAVLSMVAGQGLLLGSAAVLAYAACLALGFHLFVVLYEEPTLRRQFGEEYAAYCRRVPRWVPRLGRRIGDGIGRARGLR
jgi:protein-S-isoprenylcysteine O-methyltransferase Ste14